MRGVFTIAEVVGFHFAAQRLRSTNCLRGVCNARPLYYALHITLIRLYDFSSSEALMDLSLIFSELDNNSKYRFHLAKQEPGGTRPIDVLARSHEE